MQGKNDGATRSEQSEQEAAIRAGHLAGLHVHTEKQNIQVYALILARAGKLGEMLRPSNIDCNLPGTRKASVSSGATSGANSHQVCRLNVYEFGKPRPGDITISASGFFDCANSAICRSTARRRHGSGGCRFEWSVSFAMSSESTSEPAIYSALPEQLGIRAERRTAAFGVVVIHSVEMPKPN